MSRPLRIVHLAATPNGAPWMIALMREQRRRGHDVSAVIAGGDGSIAPTLEADGLPYQTLDLGFAASSLAVSAGRLAAIVRLLRRLRADVVHTHLFPSIVMGRLASWLADVPLRFSMIPGTYCLESPGLQDLETGTAWADTKVIATCEETRSLYVAGGIEREHVEMIPYGIEDDRFDPTRADGARVRREIGIEEGQLLVGLVAYFYPPAPDSPFAPPQLVGRDVKGHDVLLRAIPDVLARVPAARFVFVGGGWGDAGSAYAAQLRREAGRLGVASVVRFAGDRRDVPDVLAALDVALQCSLSENLGGSIEALVMGRPFVATRVGGLTDSTHHEETGLLVPPDDPRALANAIVRLLEDRALAARLGAAGRRLMLERFTVGYTGDRLDDLYERNRHALERPRYRWSTTLARIPRVLACAARLAVKVKAVAWSWRVPRRADHAKIRVAEIAAVSEGCYWLDDFCASLNERGYEAAAIVDWFPGSVAPRLAARGVRTLKTPLVFGRSLDRSRIASYLVRLPLATLRLARLLRREQIDIVHSHIFSSIVMARVASWIAGVPHVAMVPGPRHLEAPLTRAVDRLTCGLDAVTVAGCEWTRSLYQKEGVDPRRVEVIFYGVDAKRFDPARCDGARVRRELGLATDAPVAGLVAHFYPPLRGPQAPAPTRGVGIKGHEHFLSAARRILKDIPSARFLVVGGAMNPEGEAYRSRLVAACADEPRIVFTGHREDVPDVLAALDVAVQCSLTENLGGTVEALLLARGVVCTRVGGMPEAVIDGRTGLVVPPGDPESLAAAIKRLLLDRREATALGQQGRAFMLERFTLTRTIDDLDELFARLGRKGAPGPQVAVRS